MKYAQLNDVYKYGLKPNCPAKIDKEVFDEWVDGQKIILQQENEGNFLVACIDEQDEILYSFMRFFSIGDRTVCSVDFQSGNEREMIQKLTELLVKHHTF